MNEFGGPKNEINPEDVQVPKPEEPTDAGRFIVLEPIKEKVYPNSEIISEGDKKYTQLKPESFRLRDLGRNDRAFVTTKSGTEFMVRYSPRHGGFKLYSRAYDLIKGRRITDSPSGSNLLADLNSPLRVVTENPTGEGEQVWTTSPIQEIKIIKNIDSDVQSHKVTTIGRLK